MSVDCDKTTVSVREAVPETEKLFHQHDVSTKSRKRKRNTAITEPVVKKTAVGTMSPSSFVSTSTKTDANSPEIGTMAVLDNASATEKASNSSCSSDMFAPPEPPTEWWLEDSQWLDTLPLP